MTEAERVLWERIRMKQVEGCQFNRQKIIGNYIADFYCHKARLVIEVDGSQHFTGEGTEADRQRDASMEGDGIRVLRFTNDDVLWNTEDVLDRIQRAMRLR